MLPDTTKTTPEKQFLHAAALVVSETMPLEQGAFYAGCSVSALVDALHDPQVAQAVEAEVSRLRYSGDLANLKATKLTDVMLDKLLATPLENMSTGLAMKLAELGLKFRDKTNADSKPQAPKTELLILHEGDPEPGPVNDNRYRLIIRLGDPNQPRTIEHEVVTNEK